MKHVSAFLLFISLLLNAYLVNAADAVKPFTIGIGTYASTIAYDNSLVKDDDFSGFALSLGYAVSDQFGFRGNYFSLEQDDSSDLESKGIDLLGYLGVGLATHGFKAYVGGGFFSDKWELGPVSETFSGLQLSGGIGYNWDSVSLDFLLNIRDASDYEDFVNRSFPFNPVSAAAVSGSLLISYRF
ncbi:MAG: hypothetical protein KJN89_00675 [Gammaproteobacteria bacterium]|nr:hypothetical protein [Gammaproteobacteria bacterium]MBT8133880.1 hypothetical protein [Gammaproteobacteria bacterium]NNJ48854.1 hypothetical protein [Gammaproteobacteria bacterium]